MRPSNVALLFRPCQDRVGGLSACETDPTPTSSYTWLAARDKGISSFPNHSLLVSVMDNMLARVSLRRGSLQPNSKSTNRRNARLLLTLLVVTHASLH